jgi:hypothetical protein
VVRRVVAMNTPAAPELPNLATEQLLRGGGHFTSLEPSLELVLSRGGLFDSAVLSELRGTGFSDLGPVASAELLGWMKTGDLALADGTTISARLSRYDRPTLLVLGLQDNFAHPEFASALRELSRAAITVRVLNRLNFLKEDYSHLSMLHGQDVERDVFKPALDFLTGPEPASVAAETAP